MVTVARPQLAAQLPWGHAQVAGQRGGECTLRGVADAGGDLADGQFAVAQQLFGPLQAQLANVLHGRAPGVGDRAAKGRH